MIGYTLLAATSLLASASPLQDTLVVVAANSSGGVAELTVVEELRLGTLDGPEETSFGYVAGATVSQDGVLFVADAQVPAVRMFDEEGTYLGDLGREGEGPGEYQALRGIAALPDGGVAVWHEMGEVTVFDADGRFVRRFSVRLRAITSGVGPGLVADTSGALWVRTAAGPPPREAFSEIRYAWVRYTTLGAFVDSIVPRVRNLVGSPFAFRHETFTAPSPHGYFVFGRTDRYAIHRPLADGRILRLERPHEPVPIAGEERSQWERYLAAVEERSGRSFPDMHDLKPPWRHFYVGADGLIWVLRYSAAVHRPGHRTRSARAGGGPTVEWVEPARYDILDPRGGYLGTAELPPESEILFARGSQVWTLERGAFDEAYVARYRVGMR